ncbi:inhibin beta A chain [Drosophila virilis]|uniref:Uncharacterized protein, isoform A n=1 Tax=Drosophila virilis TaxID=7244 RepID=B4M9J2_DROVI|nr:inhibin beta A chain [Drosophila virilis]XP_015025178.1 inhibin beta A chain [Drosophila virilis]XP_032293566.1 inhibin beta A chain [Drosophila virilis]EDW57868.1 uncharacterized protein Dvir_GJ17906, isoform A [Drosophila virilis]KRF77991.1 uncharacterized protein Dvir_GJ17906, isoform B [Drosophila virilis]
MAKYYMTLALLLCLALENNNIYARSHPSASDEPGSMPLVRAHPHPRHQPHQQQQHQHVQQLQQHHTRQQRNRQPKRIAPDPSSEEEELQLHYDQRLRRHLRRQRDHLLQQERSYHRVTPEQLKTSPNLWQLLSQGYQFDELRQSQEAEEELQEPDEDFPQMFNDAPADELMSLEDQQDYVKNELQLSLAEPAPPAVIDDSAPEHNVSSHTNATASSGCPKCESSRQVEHITEEELRRLRIEFVKQQILEKLRLKESPKVSAVELPRPIFEGVTLQHAEESGKNKDYDDYYARTNQKFILLQREETECRRLGAHPSMCFSFKIDDADADGFDVSSAVLWLYKNKHNYTKSSNDSQLNGVQKKQTLVVSEVEQQLDAKYLPLAKTIAIQSVDVQDEWMKINIEWPIKRWFGNHELSHLIQITCESCDIESMEEIISVDKNYRPFIMIDTQNRRSKSRQKRNINCSSGVTECCREKLYISFADIGWDNWIMQPKGYDAYFCRGSCSSVASVAQAASHHSSLLKILSTNGTRKPLDLIPCCTAKQYSSLQLVVLDSNNSATIKTLPNMVVESCGCR